MLEVLREIAVEAGRPVAQVALAWAAAQPGMTSLIVGATKVAQIQDNIASLEITLTPEQLDKLATVSALAPANAISDLFGGGEPRNLRWGYGQRLELTSLTVGAEVLATACRCGIPKA